MLQNNRRWLEHRGLTRAPATDVILITTESFVDWFWTATQYAKVPPPSESLDWHLHRIKPAPPNEPSPAPPVASGDPGRSPSPGPAPDQTSPLPPPSPLPITEGPEKDPTENAPENPPVEPPQSSTESELQPLPRHPIRLRFLSQNNPLHRSVVYGVRRVKMWISLESVPEAAASSCGVSIFQLPFQAYQRLTEFSIDGSRKNYIANVIYAKTADMPRGIPELVYKYMDDREPQYIWYGQRMIYDLAWRNYQSDSYLPVRPSREDRCDRKMILREYEALPVDKNARRLSPRSHRQRCEACQRFFDWIDL
ncbi:hypothetical protein TWF696_001919 [Orbilia brochopaga]|uniref:Uncharacterized protein n=1 Tax=Orbilia brochopaga TaxID=3140254 RepID=A0AAV9UA77_9PEZI